MAKISVLTPVFNEEATILACYEEVKQVIASMGGEHTYEHIFGDNRSQDRSLAILKELAASLKQHIFLENQILFRRVN